MNATTSSTYLRKRSSFSRTVQLFVEITSVLSSYKDSLSLPRPFPLRTDGVVTAVVVVVDSSPLSLEKKGPVEVAPLGQCIGNLVVLVHRLRLVARATKRHPLRPAVVPATSNSTCDQQ